MSTTKFCLNWDSHKTNICNGLAKLQQSEEFVDMTLVADGHLVKVHKNILSLASPYIKQIISRIPSEHPIIFFSNISHETLCYILEYIYTGQVQLEIDKLDSFLIAVKLLCLPTIQESVLPSEMKNEVNIDPIEAPPVKHQENQYTNVNQSINKIGDIIIPLNDNSYTIENDDLNNIEDLIQFKSLSNPIIHETPNNFVTAPQGMNITENNISDSNINEFNNHENNINENDINPIQLNIDPQGFKPYQYTVSNRGSLQIILNRYIYSSHHQAMQGRKCRWRCIDYRLLHCKAFVDTMEETITKRINMHNHPYHDKKIMKKIKANLIYGSITKALDEAKKLNNLQEPQQQKQENH